MRALHHGHRRRGGFAVAALALSACLALVPVATAAADTVGGEGLAGTERTVALAPGAERLPTVKAETWLIADATTGEVLAQKGAHVRRAPASTLKMLTALTVMPQVPPETAYVATPAAAYTYGSRVGLKPGRTYTLDQLWYAVFLPSANDAAIAVAEANGGVKRTLAQMNELAGHLNALDTVAKTPNGLDRPGQLSSAYDLALIARAGMQRPDFAKYAGTARAEFPNVKGKGSHPIYNTNRLLLHGWKGMIGVKTGFTTHAGRTYVGAATRDGRTLLVTLMGIHESSESAARKLLSWGFANADKVTPVGRLVEPGEDVTGPQPSSPATPAAGTPSPDDPGSVDAGASGSTHAAAPLTTPMPLPLGALAGVVLVGGTAAGAVVLVRRRARSPRGRHAG
jgi:serine-type D-Ala-D-Ala carboxypeptidase (penicillin-binding protein 5/6)